MDAVWFSLVGSASQMDLLAVFGALKQINKDTSTVY